MTVEEALSYAQERAEKSDADSFDIYASRGASRGLEVFEAKISNTEIAENQGIGFRVFKGQRPGFAFTERFSKEAIEQTLKDALEHAQIADATPLDLPKVQELPRLELEEYNDELENISFDQMKQTALQLEREAKAKEGITNVPHLGIGRSSGEAWLVNSERLRYHRKTNSISAGLGVVAEKDQTSKMGIDIAGGRDWSVVDTSLLALRSAERATSMLGARPVESGYYSLVLGREISSRLIGMFASVFYGESAQKGQSKLAGRLGESIASGILDISSEPHLVRQPGSKLFDGEGVLTEPLKVVDKGVFNAFLYNLKSAKQAGVAPTGHAVRSYAGNVGTGFHNFVVPKGSRTRSEILNDLPKALLVTHLEGGSGCSAVSGEISIGLQGYLYEQGECKHPFDQVTLSTNFFDLLENIAELSSEYDDAFRAAKVPDVFAQNMYVAS